MYKELNRQQVEEYNQRVYSGEMSAHQKKLLLDIKEEEDKFWAEWDIRKDNNRGADDQ